ncbi:MAG: DNA-binding domain-containing protein [Variovorax sp.]
MNLAAFQSDFAAALFAPDAPAGLAAQPAFAVYRNTVMKGCVDALEANYPSVARLVGREWFCAAAALHVAAQPPHDGRMLRYGEGFADFLAGFEPARELGYLPDVARLDRSWTEAHSAADAHAVDGAWLAALAPETLGKLHLAPHPAARWHWFAQAPIYTVWQRNRAGNDMTEELAWQGEGALLTRAGDVVVWCAADRAHCDFLDACAEGRPLAEAAAAALAVKPGVDVADLLARLLCAGALITPPVEESAP